MLEYNILMSIM